MSLCQHACHPKDLQPCLQTWRAEKRHHTPTQQLFTLFGIPWTFGRGEAGRVIQLYDVISFWATFTCMHCSIYACGWTGLEFCLAIPTCRKEGTWSMDGLGVGEWGRGRMEVGWTLLLAFEMAFIPKPQLSSIYSLKFPNLPKQEIPLPVNDPEKPSFSDFEAKGKDRDSFIVWGQTFWFDSFCPVQKGWCFAWKKTSPCLLRRGAPTLRRKGPVPSQLPSFSLTIKPTGRMWKNYTEEKASQS